MLNGVTGNVHVAARLAAAVSGCHSSAPFTIVQAPGRVNLIGEHIDYNGGHVLPMGIGHVVGAAVRKHMGANHRVHLLNFQATHRFPVGEVPGDPSHQGIRYIAGMLKELQEFLPSLPPIELYVYGDVPLGAGLSSSAALCVATGLAAQVAACEGVPNERLARTAQRVEHRYAGVQCGIMDQMASLLSCPGHGLLLHCDTLQYSHIPAFADDMRFVLVDSGVRRQLAASKYNERRVECQEVLKQAQCRQPELRTLCHLGEEGVKRLPRGILRQRARHVVTEEARVHAAVSALRHQDWTGFGQLLVASHASLRDDYQVSSAEMDFLVDIALSVPGTLGSRMTGGGFGGCTINVVRASAVDRFCEEVRAAYRREFSREARAYVLTRSCEAGVVEQPITYRS